MTYDDNGKRFSSYFLKARNRADLAKRTETHRKFSEASYGLLGRSPDYIAGFVTGINLKPEISGNTPKNVAAYYDFMRRNDSYAAHAIMSPQAARDPSFYQGKIL